LQDEGAQDDVEAERAVFEVGVEGDPVGDLGAVPALVGGADEFDEVFVVLGHRRPPFGPHVRGVSPPARSPHLRGRATMRLSFMPSRLPGYAGWWSEPVTVLAAPGGLARFMRLWPPVYPLSPLSTGSVQKLRGHPEPRGLHRVQAPRLLPRLHLPRLHHPPPAATAHNPPPRTRVRQAQPHLRRHTRRQHRRHHRPPNREEEGKRRTAPPHPPSPHQPSKPPPGACGQPRTSHSSPTSTHSGVAPNATQRMTS